MYATGIEDTSVSIINGAICNATTTTACNQTPAKAAIGDFPTALAVDLAEHTVYIIDNRGTNVSVVRIPD
jgi:DNA-binding beta-propeller fold protein YncE